MAISSHQTNSMLKSFFGVKDQEQIEEDTVQAEDVPMIQNMEILNKEQASGKLKSMGIDPKVLEMLYGADNG